LDINTLIIQLFCIAKTFGYFGYLKFFSDEVFLMLGLIGKFYLNPILGVTLMNDP
jgi:hypothetical protein